MLIHHVFHNYLRNAKNHHDYLLTIIVTFFFLVSPFQTQLTLKGLEMVAMVSFFSVN